MVSKASNGTSYELTGPESAPILVLIHGLGLNIKTWDQYISGFTKDFRVLRYDLLGHGQSNTPYETISLSSFSLQLKELVEELKLNSLNLIGFSLGGMINRKFAMEYPELVNSLVILNSPHERSPEEQKKVEVRAAASASDGPGANLDTTIERWFTPQFIRHHSETIEQIRNWVLSNDWTVYAQSRMVLAKGVLELVRPEPPLDFPVLVMTCEHDSGSTPDMSKNISADISESKLQIVPKLQHMGLVEEPELFQQPIVSFLKSIN